MRALVKPEIQSYATEDGIALEVIFRAQDGYGSNATNLMLGVDMTPKEADQLGDRLKDLARMQRRAQSQRVVLPCPNDLVPEECGACANLPGHEHKARGTYENGQYANH